MSLSSLDSTASYIHTHGSNLRVVLSRSWGNLKKHIIEQLRHRSCIFFFFLSLPWGRWLFLKLLYWGNNMTGYNRFPSEKINHICTWRESHIQIYYFSTCTYFLFNWELHNLIAVLIGKSLAEGAWVEHFHSYESTIMCVCVCARQ